MDVHEIAKTLGSLSLKEFSDLSDECVEMYGFAINIDTTYDRNII